VNQTEGLLCGCLTFKDSVALEGLAGKADATWQETVKNPPTEKNSKEEYDMELAMVRRAFQLTSQAPPDLYRKKLAYWFDTLQQKMSEHLYHACSHPGCRMENWVLREDFDKDYRRYGLCNWTCKRGHKNSVLPSQPDINEMNKNILMHPEYYDTSCGHDAMALRRFRFCPQCVKEGLLTFAVHESGCKQWPGGGAGHGHRHCFCFHCTTIWGSAGGCNHQCRCTDPGIQQVRRVKGSNDDESLELGFIQGKAYVDWVKGGRTCPPTVFPTSQVLGLTRQGILGMEDRTVLKRTIDEGTR